VEVDKMKFEDNINISDSSSVKGYVVMKNSKGETLFKKENMIVQDGRKYIREKFIINSLLSDNSFSSTYTQAFQGYKLSKIGYGSSGLATLLTTTALADPRIYSTLEAQNIEASGTSLFIIFKASVVLTESFTIRELGLFLTKALSEDKLFSRLVFDPISLEAGETYTIDYYLYF
jgi:hypothetical protein